jgi:serine/threonine-protein kinase
MGAVYLAYQRNLRRYVALKRLSANWGSHSKAQERFAREAKAAGSLSHPGIVPIYEFGALDGRPWYSMEYIEGGDLSQMLSAHGGSLPWPEAVSILIQVSEAIQCAHEHGIAHRDLKPSNILLASGNCPKVCDFGLAWIADGDGGLLTASNEVLGTPAYLAPESVSGMKRESDARKGDIYSLGALLYHLVVGKPPFSGSHPMEILGAIVNSPAPVLSEGSAGSGPIPKSLDGICARCLEKDPADRFATVAELRRALEDCASAPPRFLGAFRVRRRTRRIISGLVLACAAIGGVYFWRSDLSRFLQGSPSGSGTAPVIAVMPLKNLGGDDETAVLALGLRDELVSTLPRISDLQIVEARSAEGVGSVSGNPGSEVRLLGANYVLEGSVQKWQDTFRTSVQLVGAADGKTLWSDHFDRPETNLLDLQTDIATQVAVHLNAHLRPGWEKRVAGTSSAIPGAEHAFLEAQRLTNDGSASVLQLQQSEKLLDQAVALDPQFALGFAALSNVHAQIYNWGNDRSEARLKSSLEAAQAAVRLNPNLAEAEIALGNYFFRGSRDFAAAEPHFRRAVELGPNDPEALTALAYLERRTGNFTDASRLLEKALGLDPMNAILAYNTADTFLRLRQYERASDIIEHSLLLIPGQVALIKLRGDLYAAWKGDLGPMGREISARDPKLPTPDLYVMDKVEWLILAHRFDDALQTLHGSTFNTLEGQSVLLTRDGLEALILASSGNMAEARNSASRALMKLGGELQKRPNEPRVLVLLGQMNILAGNAEVGEILLRRTLDPKDLAHVDAFDRGFVLRCFAIALASAGEHAKAIATINDLLAEPDQYSAKSLALHPLLEPLMKEI